MHAIDPENFKNFEWRDKNKFPQDEYLPIFLTPAWPLAKFGNKSSSNVICSIVNWSTDKMKSYTLGFGIRVQILMCGRSIQKTVSYSLARQSARTSLRLSTRWSRASDRLKTNWRNLTFSALESQTNLRKKEKIIKKC